MITNAPPPALHIQPESKCTRGTNLKRLAAHAHELVRANKSGAQYEIAKIYMPNTYHKLFDSKTHMKSIRASPAPDLCFLERDARRRSPKSVAPRAPRARVPPRSRAALRRPPTPRETAGTARRTAPSRARAPSTLCPPSASDDAAPSEHSLRPRRVPPRALAPVTLALRL